jgi:acyl-CoA synthetase (AMP-forming)/AMP-acid ligase II
LQALNAFAPRTVVPIYLLDHEDTFIWFWSVLFANAIPAIVPPLSNLEEQRNQQIQGIVELFDKPICITKEAINDIFERHAGLQVTTIEQIAQLEPISREESTDGIELGHEQHRDLAMLMLTSGSTGNAKAVSLHHDQVFAAIQGKVLFRALPEGKPFLNWIGVDHVACMTEIHLTAMLLRVDQIHVAASDIISNPLLFLDMLSDHQISRTFAPNFFMAKLVAALGSSERADTPQSWDFRHLAWMGSGGEANDTKVAVNLERSLSNYGAPPNVIVPGFGMTETCAGCIYNLECPDSDVADGNVFTSLGTCIAGAEMRVTRGDDDHALQVCGIMEQGRLEVRGSMVFRGYFNNPQATADAFVPSEGGSWFRTGDQAFLDQSGRLHMIGRIKETLNINGAKYLPSDIDSALGRSLSQYGVQRVLCFPFRPSSAATEQACIVYTANPGFLDSADLLTVHDGIQRQVMLQTTSSPLIFSLEDLSLLPTSALGKISRAKMQSLLEAGTFNKQIDSYKTTVAARRKELVADGTSADSASTSELEQHILEDFIAALSLSPDLKVWGLDTPMFDLGVTSIDIIRLKKRLGERVGRDVPVITLLSHPSVRALAQVLGPAQKDINDVDSTYDAVVILRHPEKDFTKPPL